jgi:hypothetical protein
MKRIGHHIGAGRAQIGGFAKQCIVEHSQPLGRREPVHEPVGQQWRKLLHMTQTNAEAVGCIEGRLAGEQEVKDATERIQITSPIERAPLHLFWTHIGGRTHASPGFG